MLLKRIKSSICGITTEELFKFLKSKKNKSATILEILLNFNIVQNESELSSSKRAVLRKTRKKFNPVSQDGKTVESYKIGKKHYFIIENGTATFGDYLTKSKELKLIDEIEAKTLKQLA